MSSNVFQIGYLPQEGGVNRNSSPPVEDLVGLKKILDKFKWSGYFDAALVISCW